MAVFLHWWQNGHLKLSCMLEKTEIRTLHPYPSPLWTTKWKDESVENLKLFRCLPISILWNWQTILLESWILRSQESLDWWWDTLKLFSKIKVSYSLIGCGVTPAVHVAIILCSEKFPWLKIFTIPNPPKNTPKRILVIVSCVTSGLDIWPHLLQFTQYSRRTTTFLLVVSYILISAQV